MRSGGVHAHRDEVRVWTARALATVLAEVGADFERRSGYALVVTSDLPSGFERRARADEGFDVLITVSAPLDQWIRDGRIVPTTRTDIARSGIGVAVREHAPKPDIGSVEALTRTLLDARSVAYLRVGSGLHMDGVVERLGIAAALAPKTLRPDTDIVAELVAKGEAELGIVVITQIVTTPGVALVGPLPPELQTVITFAAGVSATSSVPQAARDLIAFLTEERARAVIHAQGMEPAR